MPQKFPLIIVILIVNLIKERMDRQEGLRGLPKSCESVCTPGGWPDGPSRRLLKAMSLVCREWTKPARDALQRRIFLNGEDQLKFFQTSRSRGPWVRELQYLHYDRGFLDDPVEILSLMPDILSALPALVALSLGGERISRPLDIPRHLGFLSSAPHLRTLHIQCLLGTKHMIRIYETISDLHHLETLSLVGTWVHEFERKPLTPQLRRSHPPASLRRLLLRIKFDDSVVLTVRVLSWLLKARDNYVLHELRLVLTEVKKRHEPILTQAMSDTLPHLKILLLGVGYELTEKFCNDIVKQCTSLEELHVFNTPSFALPSSLRRFCWGHYPSYPQFPETFCSVFTTEMNDRRLSEYLRSQLVSTKKSNKSNIRFVHICKKEDGRRFYETQSICEEFQIEFVPDCNFEGIWEISY